MQNKEFELYFRTLPRQFIWLDILAKLGDRNLFFLGYLLNIVVTPR